jgi:predicted RNA-binding Zn-ribbon protein involved in translation (DUF1610 family)
MTRKRGKQQDAAAVRDHTKYAPPDYREFMKARSDPWLAQYEAATAIWQAIMKTKHKFPDDQSQRLFAMLEHLVEMMHELADVEIEPIINVVYQPKLWLAENQSDALHECPVCGELTQARLCARCLKQEAIDNGV